MAGSNTTKRGPTPIVKAYLIAYNLSAAALWGYVFLRLFTHLAGEGKVDGAEWSLKRVFGLQTELEKLQKRSATSYADFGDVTKWVQTFALLEIVHSALGLVRSGLGTTIAQLSSRIFMVWYVCNSWPKVAASAFYSSMVFAWSVTEVIRYGHYAVGLLGFKVYALEWLRYSLFYVLYPLGAGSEAALILKSAGPARHHFGYFGFFATVAIVSSWPPALLMMMQHMRKQRYVHLRKAYLAPADKFVDGKDIKDSVKGASSAIADRIDDGTKRVTRSRSKQNLKG